MLNKKLNEIEFVIFDVETTGLDVLSGDRIIEIGAKRFKDLREIAQFHSLINPERAISPGAFMVNQITQQELEGAPKSYDALPKFYDFIRDSCLVGYNVNFDLGFVENEFSLIGKKIPAQIPVIDVLKMSRRLLPDLGHYSLSFVSESLAINIPQKHRALLDVELTVEVFKRLLAILKQKGIEEMVHLLNLFGTKPNLTNHLIQQKIASIEEAIELERELKIRYFSSSQAQVTERRVSPKELRKENNRDILVGYCHLRKEERSFLVERILHLEML